MSDIDSGHAVEIEVRWPPFDPRTVIPSALPIAKGRFRLSEESETPCDLQLGDSEGFHVTRRVIRVDSGLAKCKDWRTLTSRIPNRISRARTGWFITPNYLHILARKLIPFAVIGIISSLAIHAFEPALVEAGIVDGSFAGSVRLGLLDYPILLLIFLPLFFVPIFLRVVASVWDYRRTRKFRANTPSSPKISIIGVTDTKNALEVNIEFSEKNSEWSSITAWVQVGLLNPRRPMFLHALGRKEGLQNPPGVSTPLKIHQYNEAELGTGIGESTPLQGPDAERLFLAPLPVVAKGDPVKVTKKSETVTIQLPHGNWPGTEYHPLFGSHWEILICIEQENDSPLLYVEPIIMQHDGSPCVIKKLPVQSGRSELEVIRTS